MLMNLRATLAVSVGLHCAVFAVSATRFAGARPIVLPIDIVFSGTPPAPVVPAPPEKTPVVQPPRKADTVALKKKQAPQERPAPAPAPPAPAPVAPAPVAASSHISLDTKDFPYAYYTSTIVRKISRTWQWSADFGDLKTVVYFRIARDGSVVESRVKESSGDDLYDQQAIRAIRLASPFPPLPQDFGEESLGVYFEFSYH